MRIYIAIVVSVFCSNIYAQNILEDKWNYREEVYYNRMSEQFRRELDQQIIDVHNGVYAAFERAMRQRRMQSEKQTKEHVQRHGGIMIVNEPSRPSYLQKNRAKVNKTQHQVVQKRNTAWLKRRKEQIAEEQRLARERERQRRVEEAKRKQMLYEEGKKNEYQRNEGYYLAQHQQVDYNTNKGVITMRNYDFGAKQISDVNGMVATKNGPRSLFASTKTRKIIGTAYGEFPYDFVPIKTLPKIPSSTNVENIWNSLETSLDDKDFRLLVYRLKSMNGGFAPIPLEERNGKYVFQGKDEYHFFAVSNDGHTVHGLVLEEKNWDDTEILNKAIKGEKPFTFEFTSNALGISSKNLKKMEYKSLKDLIPKLKMKIACDYFDNSSTLDYHYSKINNSNLSPEMNISVNAGGKMDATIKADINHTVFLPQENNDKTTNDKKKEDDGILGKFVSADLGYKAISAKVGGKISKVLKSSDRYMLIEIDLNVEGGIGITPSSITHYGFFAKPSKKVLVTDISDVTKDLPNHKNKNK